jgi:hypothetical protein
MERPSTFSGNFKGVSTREDHLTPILYAIQRLYNTTGNAFRKSIADCVTSA